MKTTAILTISILLFTVPVANAEPRRATASQTVTIADLNLRSAAGQRQLHKRVTAAVARACAPDQEAMPAPPLPDSHCFSRTMKAAQSQMQLAIGKAERNQALASTIGISVP